eukprot:gb/GFBE01005455.1/.p1 GENE.gb/GFBE01005455.1/~~gb/GFBE01005455.1/.p1  ORF type:complete len:221 (+),score=55.31 gb/GFBE01005455.1/:1-663(+)
MFVKLVLGAAALTGADALNGAADIGNVGRRASLRARDYPLDTDSYKEEKVFVCESVGQGCPQLTQTWGEVIATDPGTSKTETFRDVMAGVLGGKGFVKEWNWAHHDVHVTHRAGAGTDEFLELRDELNAHGEPGHELSRLLITEGVLGDLHTQEASGEAVFASYVSASPTGTDEQKLVLLQEALFRSTTVELGKTEELTAKFNEAVTAGEDVAILLHSTC